MHRADARMNATGRSDAIAEVKALQRQILRYVIEHPDAKDSAEGIRNWWLAPPSRGAAVGEIRAAVADLVRRGFIRISGRGPNTIYGAEPSRLADIRRFLEGVA